MHADVAPYKISQNRTEHCPWFVDLLLEAGIKACLIVFIHSKDT